MQLASVTLTKVSLELGGKWPSILLDDADLDIAIPGALWGVYLHSGQMCEAGTRCFVPAAMYDEVVARLVELSEALKVGSALDFDTDIGPLVDRRQVDTVERYVQIGLDEGAKLLTGGDRPDGVPAGGPHFPPAVFGGGQKSKRGAPKGSFGPPPSFIT